MNSPRTIPILRGPRQVRRARGFSGALALTSAFVVLLLSLGEEASATPAPVPCDSIGNDRYECGWWRPGNGYTGGAIVVADGQRVGYLPQGRNWIVCQQKGAVVRNSAGDQNDWYGWTTAENGKQGWVSPLDAQGGDDFGQFGGGTPDCQGKYGAPPQHSGLWETGPPDGAPPAQNPPAPAPQPPAAPKPAPAQPSSDHSTYRAGQHLHFSKFGSLCTAGFVVQVGSQYWGLSAAHCGGGAADEVFHQVGGGMESFGTIRWDLQQTAGVDALAFGAAGRGLGRWAQQIERGDKPPVTIGGYYRNGDYLKGRRLCFAGRVSGAGYYSHADSQCGEVVTNPAEGSVVCIDRPSQRGDSGGPVYTPPSERNGEWSLAVGIVSHGKQPQGWTCFTRIEDILKALGPEAGFPESHSGGSGQPLLSAVRAARNQRRSRGLRLSLRLARSATVSIQIRRAESTERWHTVQSRARAGRRQITVKRLRGRAFGRGRYEAIVTARAGDRRASPWRVQFRVR